MHELETEGAVIPATTSALVQEANSQQTNKQAAIRATAPAAIKTQSEEEVMAKVDDQPNKPQPMFTNWVMPLQGEVVNLQDLPDPAFSGGAMGAGFGIKPKGGQVVSPVAGTVTAIFPTKHAICIEAENGQELLIHVGVDTVTLEGQGFTVLAAEDAQVQPGTPLLDVDWTLIGEKATSLITLILFTNLDNGEVVEVQNDQPVLVK